MSRSQTLEAFPLAWNDETGHEIGDMCGDTHAPRLRVDEQIEPRWHRSTSLEVINGDKYYTQTRV